MEGGNWKTVSSQRRFADRNLEVMIDRVETPGHPNPRAWTIVHRKPAVVIAPVTGDGKIVLIRQERIPIKQAIWEMPSGQIDDRNSDPDNVKNVALRELREETGYELAPNGELISLGYFFSSRVLLMSVVIFFWLVQFNPARRARSGMKANPFSIAAASVMGRFAEMIAENEICDANTLGICARLVARGLLWLTPRL